MVCVLCFLSSLFTVTFRLRLSLQRESAGALWRPPFKSESSTFPSSWHSHYDHDIFLHVSEEVTDKDSIPAMNLVGIVLQKSLRLAGRHRVASPDTHRASAPMFGRIRAPESWS